MATLISRATGNFTASGTWEQVDSTSLLDSSAASTAISTSNLDSSTFTPGAITVTGIALKIAARAASPSGTFTVTLRNSTDAVDVTSVTVNVSDLPYYATSSLGHGWVFFKFSSSQLLVAGKAYLVRVVCSTTGSQVTLYRNATSNNWSRMLATTTTAAPASGDQLLITGERTGTGSGNSFTVTLDNTATTSFGPTVSGGPPQGIIVSQGGTFICGTTASTAYYFKWKGVLHICSGGVMEVGSSGTPIPSSSSCTLFMDCVANTDTGIVVDSGGTLTIQGATKNPWTQINTDEAASSTVIGLDSTSGWEANDVLGIGPGNVTVTEVEQKTISTVDSATQVTLSSGLTNQKRGTAPHKTYVANMTRNVKITGASSTLRGYLSFREVCTAVVRYVQFTFMGGNTTGIYYWDFQPHAAGTATVEYCTTDTGNNAIIVASFIQNKSGTVVMRYNVFYRAGNICIYSNNGYGGGTNFFVSCIVTDNIFVGNLDGTTAIYLNIMRTYAQGWDFRRNIITGNSSTSAAAIVFNLGVTAPYVDLSIMFDDTVITHQGTGFHVTQNNACHYYGIIQNPTVYLCANQAFLFNSTNGSCRLTLTNVRIWGNAQAGIYFGNSTDSSPIELTIRGGTICGSTLQAQPRGLWVVGDWCKFRAENVDFGVATGTDTTHSTGDVVFNDNQGRWDLLFVGCALASATKITGHTGSDFKLYDIRHQRYNNTAGDHRRDVQVGAGIAWTHRLDTVRYDVSSPTEKIAPSITVSYAKAESAVRRVRVLNGVAKTISCKVWKSSSAAGDSANYNGAEPRLIRRANPAIGLDSDTVIDTMTAAIGNWEQLTGSTGTPTDDGVVEFYVDCDGTAGHVNVGEFTVS
jgi:hypothetical protein